MTDITLKINGDSSGAAAALNDAGGAVGDLSDDVGKSVVKWQEFANITKKAVEAVVRFGMDAVKAYGDAERVQAQLTRVAGKYSDAISEQAEALSKLYAVDDDVIKQSSTLMVQWGGVGAASEKTTKAILDYAAATGQDAVAATQDLIRNMESGGVGLAKMGVHFTSTGDKGKDLAAAVAALNAKFGGAAAADAGTLQGSLNAAGIAFEDLKKDLGASIAQFVQQTGAVGALTTALRNLREFMNPDMSQFDESIRMADWVNAQTELLNAQQALADAKADPNASITILEMFQDDVDRAQKKVDALKASAQGIVMPGLGDVTGTTNKGLKERAEAAKKAAEEEAKLLEQVREADAKANDAHREAELAAEQRYAQESIKVEEDRIKESQAAFDLERAIDLGNAEIVAKDREDNFKGQLKAIEGQNKDIEKENKAHLERMKEQEQLARQAGDAIGAAFVSALGDQLQKLASGEEFDAALFVGDILASIITVAASVIGSAYGQPALGAAVGNLAAVGVRAGAAAISRGQKKKYHEGGWIGDEAELPRYHSGGWLGAKEVPIIGLENERVLSHAEIKNMGGPAAVDRAASGKSSGPSINVSVMSIDAKNTAEGFIGALGQGLKRALRSGQGDVPALLGVNPR